MHVAEINRLNTVHKHVEYADEDAPHRGGAPTAARRGSSSLPSFSPLSPSKARRIYFYEQDLTLGTVPTAVVWPPLPAPFGAKSLTSIAAGTTDGRFYVADRGASVVWSLAVPLQVSAANRRYIGKGGSLARAVPMARMPTMAVLKAVFDTLSQRMSPLSVEMGATTALKRSPGTMSRISRMHG